MSQVWLEAVAGTSSIQVDTRSKHSSSCLFLNIQWDRQFDSQGGHQLIMQVENQRESIMQDHLSNAKPEEMAAALSCGLCGGLLRVAHTLADCGHSFCQLCIFGYVNAFKGRNPDLKCPSCHVAIDSCLHRSLFRDPFKQRLVDLLDPHYHNKQKTLIQRTATLFPDYNLTFLLDDLSPLADTVRRRRAEKTRVMSNLAAAVKNKLGISFQTFSEHIAEEDGFAKLQAGMAPAKIQEKGPLTLDLRPRGHHDFRFVGVNSRLKGSSYLVQTIRKFLEKRVLLRLQAHEELARQLIEPECSELQIRVELFFEDRVLEDGEDLGLIAGIDQEPIYYRLR